MVGLQLAAPDVVDQPHGLKRVLVDRIGMVHVELGLADDPAPFGQEPAQQTRLVHQGQDTLRVPAPGQDIQKDPRGFRIPTDL